MSSENVSTRHGIFTLSMLQVGGFASIPPLMVGYMLAKQLGLYCASFNILIGNCVVFLLAVPIGIQATKDRKISALQVQDILGSKGNKIAILGLLILIIGWFGLNINLIGVALLDVTTKYFVYDAQIFAPIFNIAVGGCIIFIVSRGIVILKNFTQVFVILFFLTILINLLATSSRTLETFDLSSLSIVLSALFFVIACPIGQIFDLPTFHRFAKTKVSSVVSNIIVFLVLLPFVEIIGSLLYTYYSTGSIISALMDTALPTFVFIWNVIFIATSVCSIDNINLYVLSVNSKVLLPKLSFEQRTYIIGLCATLLSITDVLNNFASILNYIVVIIAAILALLVIRAFVTINTKVANLALLLGVLLGFSNRLILPLYDFPYILASISTAVFYFILIPILKT